MRSAPLPHDGRSISETMTPARTSGLVAAIETPLGPIVDGTRFRRHTREDRLDELSFELPLAGGDNPTGAISMLDVARVLNQSIRSGDPLHEYAERLSDPVLARDVQRVLDRKHRPRVQVRGQSHCDRGLQDESPRSTRGVPLSAWDYRFEALEAEMHHAHYPLQAMLYTVALHRYMSLGAIPDTTLRRGFAGVLYLFVRGMSSDTFLSTGRIPAASGPGDRLWR